jgi:hypothetical protein
MQHCRVISKIELEISRVTKLNQRPGYSFLSASDLVCPTKMGSVQLTEYTVNGFDATRIGF